MYNWVSTERATQSLIRFIKLEGISCEALNESRFGSFSQLRVRVIIRAAIKCSYYWIRSTVMEPRARSPATVRGFNDWASDTEPKLDIRRGSKRQIRSPVFQPFGLCANARIWRPKPQLNEVNKLTFEIIFRDCSETFPSLRRQRKLHFLELLATVAANSFFEVSRCCENKKGAQVEVYKAATRTNTSRDVVDSFPQKKNKRKKFLQSFDTVSRALERGSKAKESHERRRQQWNDPSGYISLNLFSVALTLSPW
jgi:hypothetical protein